MEQQTISIAKAGITTMLKSRTSVLAAANPPSGKYDDLKTAQENIDLQTTILSRFDLIFIVKDERSVRRSFQHRVITSQVTMRFTMDGRPSELSCEDAWSLASTPTNCSSYIASRPRLPLHGNLM